jgi:predicted enzyme related to lactoylglutathione lyase
MAGTRGKFIWYDVMTNETKAGASFYSDVIGWGAQEHVMPDNRTYTVFSKGPVMVAGLMAIPEPMRAQGARPCWSGYVAVDDVDIDAARVKAAGGAIQREPTDIPNVGRFAVVSDPGGAVFLLFTPNTQEQPKAVAPMTPGHVGWHELYAGNLDREFAFYSRLFGWTKDRAVDLGPAGTYQTFATDGTPCGAMMTRCAQVSRPCWNYYIAVDSVAVAAERTTSRGGQVLHGPHEVPGGAWIVQARDPQGAAFAMISGPK